MKPLPSSTDRKEMERLATGILEKMTKEGKTLKEAAGVSDRLLEEIYTLSYAYYNQGKYKESLSLFQFLAAISPDKFKYVFGLAASHHQLLHYEDAIMGFFLAFNLVPENPLPPFYIAECLLKLDDIETAREFLEIARDIAGDRPEYASIKERCEMMLKA